MSGLTKKGVTAEGDIADLKKQLAAAKKDAQIYKSRWEWLLEETKLFREAVKYAPRLVKEFLASVFRRPPEVKTVVVKDMSRLGRDYLKVGFYTEVLFPEKGVRFIAINNGIDSNNQQDSDFTPFLNIINEWYAKDTSKKIRAVMKSKGEADEYLCTHPPYGYKKDSKNPKKWIVDEEAAQVVRHIYALCLEGYGSTQIARILKENNIPVPTAFWLSNGRKPNTVLPDNPCKWVSDTVAYIF